MINHGSFVISLDFEMMWGVKDICTPDGYGSSNVKHVKEVVERIVALLEKYDVRATFATVGLMFFKDKHQALQHLPKRLPQYDNRVLSPFENDYIAKIEDRHSDLYFVPDIISLLHDHPNIELATHTFSHYNCWAAGQIPADFEEDLKAAIAAAELCGFSTPTSIVFPRNNVAEEYLEVCKRCGITTYRGNARRFYTRTTCRLTGFVQRIMRLVDSYVNVGGNSSVSYDELSADGVVNVQASRFLRPYSKKLAFLERFKICRIKNEIRYAAKYNELYHLWWHPHNFGDDIEENLANLEKILKVFSECRTAYGMQSCTMQEFSNLTH